MTDEQKLTPWFPPSVEPARPGVYRKDFGSEVREFQYWDGARWHYGAQTPAKTLVMHQTRAYVEPLPRRWRGLAKDPK